jgi:hypothetical protein
VARLSRKLKCQLARPTFWASALLLSAWLVAGSWMRWMNPQIDFGHEVYTPWRLLQGEHLGKILVGPLSNYVNAGIFAIGGVSVRTLVIANLAIFAGIVVLLHRLLRQAFGFLAASLATLGTVAVFGFGDYVASGNYNYAAPYIHAATHGMLLLLLFANLLLRPLRNRWVAGVPAGAVLGLLTLTKVEFLLTAAALLGAFALFAMVHRQRQPWGWIAGCVLGATSVALLAGLLLAVLTSEPNPAWLVTAAMLGPFRYSAYFRGTYTAFLGWDAPGRNLLHMAWTTASFLAGVGMLALWFRAGERLPAPRWRWAVVAVATTLMLMAATEVRWLLVASVFPGALLVILAIGLVRIHRTKASRTQLPGRFRAQGILLVAALAMLTRMALAPRLYHYGFFQAMLAGAFLLGFLLRELPCQLARTRAMQRGLGLAVAVFLAVGASDLVRQSQAAYARRTLAFGEGADRLYAFPPDLSPEPTLLEAARRFLQSEPLAKDATVAVVPEGCLLNFQLRKPSPQPFLDFLPAVFASGSEQPLRALQAHPPDYVVAISRPMRELGYPYFGSEPASGQFVAEWIESAYEERMRIGAHPFHSDAPGLVILRYRGR